MYNRPDFNEECCFVVVKRPCHNSTRNSSNFPQDLYFNDNEEMQYEERQEERFYDWNEQYEQGYSKNQHSCRRCNCCRKHDNCNHRPCDRKRCCFNFFRWC